MEGNGILIASLVVLLAASAFFSASETAYSSLNKIRLKSAVAQGNKRAARALELAGQYDKLLSTVLVGNNIVNILSTALATVLFVSLFGNLGATISTVVMTVLVLLFGEISPKTIAKESPEKFAVAVAPFLHAIMVILTPVNFLLTQWKKMLLKVFKIKGSQTITEQELLTYVEEARQEGGINEQEEGMIRQVIEFDDLEAGDILTPRVDLEAVEVTDPVEGISALFHESGYSRLPVYRDTLDSIIGVVLYKDFHYYVEQNGKSLETVIKPVVFTTKTVKIATLLKLLQEKKSHIAVVIDEFGGTVGIVTVEDIVEELVGEIWDEHDDIVRQIEPAGEGKYRILGSTSLREMLALFGKESASSVSTVGGWAVEVLGRFPAEGESFIFENLHVTVTKILRQRVLEILVEVVPPL